MRNYVVSKINDTKEEITAAEFKAMRDYLRSEFNDDCINVLADEEILILYLKQCIADMVNDAEYYYFDSYYDTDLFLCVKALKTILG